MALATAANKIAFGIQNPIPLFIVLTRLEKLLIKKYIICIINYTISYFIIQANHIFINIA